MNVQADDSGPVFIQLAGGLDDGGRAAILHVHDDGTVVLSQADVDRIAHAVVARLIRAQQMGANKRD